LCEEEIEQQHQKLEHERLKRGRVNNLRGGCGEEGRTETEKGKESEKREKHIRLNTPLISFSITIVGK